MPSSKYLDQRVGVFVDVQNLYYSARSLYNARVNFANVLKEAVGERKLVRAIAYVIRASIPEEKNFFAALEKSGYEVKAKDLQIFPGGAKKGDWDVGITMDMVQMMSKLDAIIIASGDGDYEDAVRYLKANGTRVEAIAFGRSTSSKLKDVVDDFIDLDDGPRKYLFPMRR
ncbi:MAG: NYN domain-containing protein [Patescibacteria group bacterium]|nr:NYN domain-containing protein [Patescibacteria group bacterium]